jgi:signal transduction histidine kinase
MPSPPDAALPNPDPRRRLALVGLGLLLLGNAVLPLLYGLHRIVWILDYLDVLGLAFWAAALCWRRARAEGPPAFLLLGLGAALGGLRYVPTMLSLPGASLAGPALSILGLVALGAGFLRWPQQTRLPRDRVRTTLDGLAIAFSLFTVTWLFLGATNWEGRISHGMVVVYLIQISACLGVFSLWLLQETRLRQPEQARTKQLVRWALLALLAHSTLGSLLRFTGSYYPGYLGHATEVLHQAANLLLALAAMSPDTSGEAVPAPQAASSLRAVMPSAISLTVVLLAMALMFRSQRAMSGVILGLCLVLLAIQALRHGLLVLDLERLSLGLEARVEARTQELEAHHQAALGDLRIRMMAGLAAGLAHDLNNILGIIRLRVDLLETTCSPAQAEDLKVLGEASTRAAALTRRILASGRIQDLSPTCLDFSAWMAARRDLFQALMRPGQTLDFQVAPDLQVLADPQSLDQVFENLVTNARDALGPRGTLRVRAGSGPDLVRVSLQDDGPGIAPEHLERLFEPFFTTKPSGTGLGLATVRNLVVQNRGSIRVESRPGAGTTFHIELPAAPGLF